MVVGLDLVTSTAAISWTGYLLGRFGGKQGAVRLAALPIRTARPVLRLRALRATRRPGDPRLRRAAPRQGKTNREIKRCLVRYVARQLYRLLEANPCFDPT